MTFRVVLEFDQDTDSYSAVCPELPGCASADQTEDEAKANIEEAIRPYLAPSEIALPSEAKLSGAASLRPSLPIDDAGS